MNHDPLQQLTRQWKTPPAPATLEQDVLRRIRLARPETDPWLVRCLEALAFRPAAAVAAAAMIGLLVALAAEPRTTAPGFSLFRNDSITGSYALLGQETTP